MDRSLWLLLTLRGRAWFRRWTRGLRTLKGVLLAVIGSLVFLPYLITMLFVPRVQTGSQVEMMRLYGPLALLAYCVLNVVLSSGERAIYYSPAEVNFLFAGPYSPRQLLIYKVASGLAAGLLTSAFLVLAFRQHAVAVVPAFVGLFFGLECLYLFSLAVGLLTSTFGAMAFSVGRKLILLGVAAVAALVFMSLGKDAIALGPEELLRRALTSPVVGVVVAPFRPFVMAFTAERVWPDLAGWAAASLAVDAALFGLVLALNAQFLEASAGASARVYERVKRMRRGETFVTGTPRVRFSLPMFPRMGGVGPNLWRQWTTASRTWTKLVGVTLIFLLPALAIFVLAGSPGDSPSDGAGAALSAMAGIVLFAPTMVGFDFRADLGRMEDLKALPIPPGRLVIGELITPTLVLSLGAWIALGFIFNRAPKSSVLLLSAAALTLPLNFLLVAVENLYFLLFPYRLTGFNTFDFQAMGRQMLLLTAKMLTVAVAGSLAAGAGALVYFYAGQRWTSTIAAAWVVLLLCGLGLVPLLAGAFERFDVAQGPPD